MYPNPAHDILLMKLPGLGTAQVELRDLLGRVLLPLAPLALDQQLRLPPGLAAGEYLLEVHYKTVIAVLRVEKL